jgi:DNA-binding NarL/FixJ family response regulator
MDASGGLAMIRVIVADDQTLVRLGLRNLLELNEDFEVVGEAADGEEAIRILSEIDADVVLLDVRMPKKTGVEVLEECQRAGLTTPAILLTTFDEDSVALAGIRAGAKGFLLKDVSLAQLTTAVRTVAAGQTLFQPVLTERLLRSAELLRPRMPSSDYPEALTPRETEVLRLMAGGYSNREIANALGTVEGTVKNQTSSILSKLGVRDRTRAVLKALELGII